MVEDIGFLQRKVAFVSSGKHVTKEQIDATLPFDFNGKGFFIQFYLKYNGGYFPDGAHFCRTKIYPVMQDRFTSLGIEMFYFIPRDEGEATTCFNSISKMWNLSKSHSIKPEAFLETHFPFACDAGGNDFWINIETGEVEYFRLDSVNNSVIVVAPSFYDFCNGIEAENEE